MELDDTGLWAKALRGFSEKDSRDSLRAAWSRTGQRTTGRDERFSGRETRGMQLGKRQK